MTCGSTASRTRLRRGANLTPGGTTPRTPQPAADPDALASFVGLVLSAVALGPHAPREPLHEPPADGCAGGGSGRPNPHQAAPDDLGPVSRTGPGVTPRCQVNRRHLRAGWLRAERLRRPPPHLANSASHGTGCQPMGLVDTHRRDRPGALPGPGGGWLATRPGRGGARACRCRFVRCPSSHARPPHTVDLVERSGPSTPGLSCCPGRSRAPDAPTAPGAPRHAARGRPGARQERPSGRGGPLLGASASAPDRHGHAGRSTTKPPEP